MTPILHHRDKLFFARATNRAGIGRRSELDIAADRAQIEARPGEVFALLHSLQRALVQLGVDGFRFHREPEHDPGAVTFGLGLLEHGRVHGGVFVRLTRDGRLEVVACGRHSLEGLQVPFGMNALGFRRRPEQARDVGKTIQIRLLRERPVFLVGLALAGESQASQKYRAFARKAEQDGLPNVARLFRTAAEAEVIHAQGHFRAMDGVASTADNLKAAIAGETYEFTTMYPPMLAEAQAEGHRAKLMFGFAMKAEAVHAELYKRALEAVEQGKDLAEAGFYLCPVCGNIEFGTPPDNCPICGTRKDRFVAVA